MARLQRRQAHHRHDADQRPRGQRQERRAPAEARIHRRRATAARAKAAALADRIRLADGGDDERLAGVQPIERAEKWTAVERQREQNAQEAAMVPGIEVFGVRGLRQAWDFLNGDEELAPVVPEVMRLNKAEACSQDSLDLDEVLVLLLVVIT